MNQANQNDQKVIVDIEILNKALGLIGEGVYTLPIKEVNAVINEIQQKALAGIEEYNTLTAEEETEE